MLDGGLIDLAAFITAPSARNIGFRALDSLDHTPVPRFNIRPLLALGDQPHSVDLPITAKFRRQPGIAEKFDTALPEEFANPSRRSRRRRDQPCRSASANQIAKCDACSARFC